jgi:hypothetical protein
MQMTAADRAKAECLMRAAMDQHQAHMGRNTQRIREAIERNAAEIRRLHGAVHETLKTRSLSPAHEERWKQACAVFHGSYDRLAMPGGYGSLQFGLAEGDPNAVETALCFLELRPYFFRSGYMFKALLRKVRRANLDEDQKLRLLDVMRRQQAWKDMKRAGAAAPDTRPH